MTLEKLAQGLFIIKPILNITFIAGMVFTGYLFLNSTIAAQNSYGLPSLLLATWSLLLSALIGLLVNVPSNEDSGKGWFARIKKRIAKTVFTAVAVVFIFISVALLYATIKLLTL